MTGTIATIPRFQFSDALGNPLVNGTVNTYLTNSTTPTSTWQDQAQTSLNTNPIILDSTGSCVIWLDPLISYTFVIKNSAGVIQWTQNTISGLGSSQLVFQNALAASSGSSLVGFIVGTSTQTLQSKSGERRSVEDYGGGVGATNATNLTAFNALISAMGTSARYADLNGRSYTLSGAPTNTYGLRFYNGKIIIPSGVGTTQWNTYADDSALLVGRENMSVFWREVTANTLQNVYIFGDSTVQNDASFPLKSHELVQRAFYSNGINNAKTFNMGVSGTSWSDLNVIPSLGASTKFIVIKYGINDEVKSTPLATMASDARAKLTAIRADANGAYTKLSILLMGPNTTYRPSNGQTAQWYEDVKNIYLALAREFNCTYFDSYSFMQDAKLAPGLWMDNIGGTGEGIHPDPIAVYRYWWEAYDIILGGGQANTQKSNQNWNINNYTRIAFPTSEPQTYPFGSTFESALLANGWPFTGVLTTIRQADGNALQTLTSLDVVPRQAYRTGAALVWTQWSGVSVAISAFLNSWANKGGGYAPAAYVVDNGFIELSGVISAGSIGVSSFTLPANARPGTAHVFPCTSGGTVTVFSDGNVITGGGTNTTVSLDAMRFKVL
tara:strand:- start:298 stop:2130 length:1833 start_codon:yes stop_codon:yes gene_type:complete